MKIKIILLVLSAAVFGGSFHARAEEKYQLSTHILDISQGQPARGVIVSLYKYDQETLEWTFVDKALTRDDGRISELLPSDKDNYGAYKLRFETEDYFKRQSLESIYPYIEVCFYIKDKGHYHIPLTVSANGYSTYRGS